MKRIFVLEPGLPLRDGLFLVNDDDSIRRVLNHITQSSWVGEVEFFTDHDVDTPEFGTNMILLCNQPFDENSGRQT